jgi:hypothetical protein
VCRARQKNKKRAAPEPVFTVGEAGLVMVEYVGWLDLDHYTGEVTGATYWFGLERLKGFVDARDAPYFAEIEEDGQLVFKVN